MSGLVLAALLFTGSVDPPRPLPVPAFVGLPPRPIPILMASRTTPPVLLYRQPVVPRYQPPPRPRYVPASTVLTYWVDGLPGRDDARAWRIAWDSASRWSAVADVDLLPSRSRHEAAMVIKPRNMSMFYAGLTDMGHPDDYASGRTGVVVGINPHFRGGDDYLTSVLTHEIGHALGLSHRTDGIMNGRGGLTGSTPVSRYNAEAVASLYGYRKN